MQVLTTQGFKEVESINRKDLVYHLNEEGELHPSKCKPVKTFFEGSLWEISLGKIPLWKTDSTVVTFSNGKYVLSSPQDLGDLPLVGKRRMGGEIFQDPRRDLDEEGLFKTKNGLKESEVLLMKNYHILIPNDTFGKGCRVLYSRSEYTLNYNELQAALLGFSTRRVEGNLVISSRTYIPEEEITRKKISYSGVIFTLQGLERIIVKSNEIVFISGNSFGS